MKIVKWLLGIVIGLVLLGAVAVGVLTLVVSPEKIEQEVATRFQAQTGHSLRIEAPIQWSVFPWLGLHLEKVKVGNAPGFGETPLATIQELEVKVALMPLLKKRITVDTVVLKGVRLNLARNEKGQPNWAGFTGKEAQPTTEGKTANGGEASGPGYALALKGIEIQDLDLDYVDRQKQQSYRLQDLFVTVGEVKPDTPVMVRIETRLQAGKPAVTMKLALSGKVTFSADYGRIDLSALAATLDAKGKGLPSEGVKLKLAGNLALDLDAGKLAATDLALSGPAVNVTGELKLAGLKQGKLSGGGHFRLQQTSLRSLLQLAGVTPDTADPEALSRISAELPLALKGDSLTLDPVKVVLDDTHIDGRLALLSFTGPVVRARFKVDAIDLDRYLPPAGEKKTGSEAGAKAGTTAQAKSGGGKAVDFSPLRKLDVDARLEVAKLRVEHLNMEGVVVVLKAKKGVVRLDPVSARLYQGKLAANARLDVRKEQPAIATATELSGIQIGPLLADLTGKDRLTGTGNVKFKLQTRGLADKVLRRNLDGDFSVSLRDGAYKGFNIADLIRRARAAIKGETLAQAAEAQTDFAELRATGVIRHGVVTNRDLYLASPVLRVKGEGTVDLVQERIDYRLLAKVVGSLEGQGGKSMEELKGVPVPVRITGSLADPKPQVDAEALVKALAQQKIEEKKEEVMQKAGKEIEKKLGTDVLKGLFGK